MGVCSPRRFIRGSLIIAFLFSILFVLVLHNPKDVMMYKRFIHVVPNEDPCNSLMQNISATDSVLNGTQSRDLVSTAPRQLITVEDVINESILKSPVVMICINSGFLEFLDNLLCSIFHVELLQNILIVCEDELAYQRLSAKFKGQSIRVALTNQKYSPEGAAKRFSKDYKELVRKRVSYIEMLLQNNFDVFYIDADIVLVQNPLLYFTGDFDAFVQIENPPKMESYCSGFFYMKSNNMTLKFVKTWQSRLLKDPQGNQIVFARMLRFFDHEKLLKIRRLPHKQFSSGKVFFASKVPWQKRQPPVVAVHANWIVGHDQKKQKLKDAKLWFINGTKCILPS
ncbi:UDP-D-xylose:L-fucose alpha-1,3-D-xylosyltransferase 3 [Holothuria leucospilota]|uniref:UDP-D-xylose:L-fucose alpha-1,3-D-xylosyltransferase 3 n=1 Tax=Holothuria leucospilota TaxID=206669 RepID=A0A9Q1HA81_HOLLE|nr:UDP-D-xylose:L-fucose alpha-1,3-D-xylosyltransferase 3 [Holothuria leucospilota]